MADNVAITAGTGTSIATDDVGGVQYQRVKNTYGADGTATDVSDAAPMPSRLATSAGAADVTVATTGSTTLASDLMGANHALVMIQTTRTGNFNFEVTVDGTTWSTAEVWDANNNLWITGVITPTAGNKYRVRTTGYTALRATVASTLSGTSPFRVNLVHQPTMHGTRLVGPAPHNFGFAPTVVRATGTGTVANTTNLIAAPASGLAIIVTDIQVSNSGSALTVVTLGPGSGFTPVYDFPIAASGGGASMTLQTPWKLAAATGVYYAVSVATTSWYLTLNYYVAQA